MLSGWGKEEMICRGKSTIYHQDFCLGEIMFWLASLVFSSSLSPDLEGKCMMNLRTVAWIFSVPLILVYNNLMKNL